MMIHKAIFKSVYQWYIDNSNTIAIYRESKPDYIFIFASEYSKRKTIVGKMQDINSWRYGIGTFGEILIPEDWLTADDWTVYIKEDRK